MQVARPGGTAGVVATLLAHMVLLGCGLSQPHSAVEPAQVQTDADGAAYEWRLPKGFPEPLVPADNPMSEAKVRLGRHLFYDRRLSGNETMSCADCHQQSLAFTDGRATAVGSTGEFHPRGSMSLANVAYSRTLNWADPTADRLEEQLVVPMFNQNPIELGLAGREREVEARLRADDLYQELFALAFPGRSDASQGGGVPADPISLDNVMRALASFERTLISGDSAYDRLVFEDDRGAISDQAWRGMRLFFSERLGCFECHSGMTFSGPVVHRRAPQIEPVFHNTGLYALLPEASYPVGNRGIYEITLEGHDMGRFKAPTLRNIALTAPYMHDGSIRTLEEVVDHYAAGGRLISLGAHAGDGRASPFKSELVAGFEITAEERAEVVAFLEALTDDEFLTSTALADPWPEVAAAEWQNRSGTGSLP